MKPATSHPLFRSSLRGHTMHGRSFLHVAALSLSLTLAFQLPAQQQAPLHTASQEELDVVKVLIKQEAAWNRGDIDKFAEGYKDSPDTIFISRTVSRGYASMITQ